MIEYAHEVCQLRCDLCGNRGPVFHRPPEHRTEEAVLRTEGWSLVRVDVCPGCHQLQEQLAKEKADDALRRAVA